MHAVTDDDPVLRAMDDLVAAGRENVVAWMGIMERVDAVRDLRRQGVPYTQMSLPDGVPIIDAIGAAQDRLTTAAARFRRASARELHDSGLSLAEIGRLFGVSRQRIASILEETELRDTGEAVEPQRGLPLEHGSC